MAASELILNCLRHDSAPCKFLTIFVFIRPRVQGKLARIPTDQVLDMLRVWLATEQLEDDEFHDIPRELDEAMGQVQDIRGVRLHTEQPEDDEFHDIPRELDEATGQVQDILGVRLHTEQPEDDEFHDILRELEESGHSASSMTPPPGDDPAERDPVWLQGAHWTIHDPETFPCGHLKWFFSATFVESDRTVLILAHR